MRTLISGGRMWWLGVLPAWALLFPVPNDTVTRVGVLSSPSAFKAGLARQRVRAETTIADARRHDIRRLPSVRLLTQAAICRVRGAHNIRVKNTQRSYKLGVYGDSELRTPRP